MAQAETIRAIALDGPLTAKEVQERLGYNYNPKTELRRMWEQGLLVRRERETEQKGKNPYEYKLKA